MPLFMTFFLPFFSNFRPSKLLYRYVIDHDIFDIPMKHAPGSCKNIFFAFALLVLLPVGVRAQKKDNLGKEFYVAFAENHGSGDESKNFFALFITSKTVAQGKVEVTALGFSQNFTSTPGTVTTIELPDGKNPGEQSVELTFNNNQEEQVVRGMAVHITSDNEIAVYGMNHKEFSSDAFMALPIDVLGTEYRTLNYQTSVPGGFGSGGATPGEFWIVGVQDSTNITITPKSTTAAGRGAGSTIKALLYKGDVFLVQGRDDDEQNDLTGSLIEADQSIAVFSGHVRTDMPHGFTNIGTSPPSTSRDHLCEQLPPVSAWGDSALVVRYQSASRPDLVRIVSSEDGNVVKINGGVVATLNAGDFYEYKQLAKPISIQATSPILVGQYMHTSLYGTRGPIQAYGDPAYALVFPVEQFDTSYTFMLDENPAAYDSNFVNIVADPGGVASMMLDGQPITGKPFLAAFLPIPGSNYVYSQIELPQGAHNIYSKKSFGITAYALGNVDSYSYPGGTLLKTITPFKTVSMVIDFGDRVLTPPAPYNPGVVGVNRWDTTVYLQNISSDPYNINGFVTQGGNGQTNFSVPRYPKSIGAGILDSMVIEFTPNLADVEFHTTIKAQTDHLRAYVVDVYGRGILENAQVFSDSTARSHIDTLDFGVLDASVDPPKDSFVFVINKGEKDLIITGDAITGTNAADFAVTNRTIKSKKVGPSYTLHPYNLLGLQDSSAKITITFTPRAPNGLRTAELHVQTAGQERIVILIAHIKTILKSTVLNATFDTAFICESQTRSIFVDNPNDFPITVKSVNLGGTNPGDFSLVTQMPLVIAPASRGEIQLQYAPNVVGMSNATAIVSFDLPKGFADTLHISAFGDQYSSRFWARGDIHILPGEETLFPIYARSPMQIFASPTFVLTVSYDPANLEDKPFDFVQVNTLTETGYFDILSDTIGYTQYIYHTMDNSVVTGGSDTEQKPLVYIKFKSHLNDGDDPAHFHKDLDITYNVGFNSSQIPSGCIASFEPAGRITLDSTCETVYLFQDTLLFPPGSYIEPVRPNPASSHVKFVIDVPKTDVVKLDVIDMLGNNAASVLDEIRKPGTYEVRWDASKVNPGMYYVRLRTSGEMKFRQMVIVR